MRFGELRDEPAFDGLPPAAGTFPRRYLHALDAVDPRAAGRLHFKHAAASAGGEVVHPPCQPFAEPGNKEPSHQLLPFDRKRRRIDGFDLIIGKPFGHLFHTAFSFRSFGAVRIRILRPEAALCRVQPAFDRPDRDAEPRGDFRLRQLPPEIQVQKLPVLLAQQPQRLPHGIRLRNAVPAVRQDAFGRRIDGEFKQRCLFAEVIGAFVPRDAEYPRFEGIFVP